MAVPIRGGDGVTTYQERRFRMWCISVHADFPAAGKLTPCPESTSAKHPSRASNWDSKAENAFAPSSFLRKFKKMPPDPARQALWELRTLQRVEQDIQHASTLRGGAQKVYMQSKGLNALACAPALPLLPFAPLGTACPPCSASCTRPARCTSVRLHVCASMTPTQLFVHVCCRCTPAFAHSSF